MSFTVFMQNFHKLAWSAKAKYTNTILRLLVMHVTIMYVTIFETLKNSYIAGTPMLPPGLSTRQGFSQMGIQAS